MKLEWDDIRVKENVLKKREKNERENDMKKEWINRRVDIKLDLLKKNLKIKKLLLNRRVLREIFIKKIRSIGKKRRIIGIKMGIGKIEIK